MNAPEPLLRFPLEILVALHCSFVGVIFAVFPQQLFLLPQQGWAFAAVFACLGMLRGFQGMRLIRYQRRLIKRPLYQINQIPSDPRRIGKQLFLGRGFRWKQAHVQRLKEARSHRAARYAERAKSDNGDPFLHGVGLLRPEREVWSSLAERNGHMIVLGATRVGKTRLAELLIGQDIHRGDTVVVLDPKGDVELLQRIYYEAGAAGRLDDLRMFHLRHPELSEKYNPLASYNAPGEIASRISMQLPGSGESAAFQSFAWRFVNSIAVALDELRITPTFSLIYRYIEDVQPLFVQYHDWLFDKKKGGDWRAAVHRLAKKQASNGSKVKSSLRHCEAKTLAMIEYKHRHKIGDDVAADLQALLEYDRIYYDKITASLKPLLNKLKTGPTADMLSPVDGELALDWATVISRSQIVYVGLDSLANPEVGRAVGNTMFADLASTIGQIYAESPPAAPCASSTGRSKRPPVRAKTAIVIHADEFNDIVGPHLHPMLSKAGGAGVQITAYTQTLADIEAAFGSRAQAAQIVGNFNSMIMLRVRTLDTARVFSDQTARYDVIDLSEGASVADSSQAESDVSFTSSSNERLSTRSVQSVDPSDLMTLPKGEAFAILDGGTVWKLRIPLIRQEKALAKSAEEILTDVRRRSISAQTVH